MKNKKEKEKNSCTTLGILHLLEEIEKSWILKMQSLHRLHHLKWLNLWLIFKSMVSLNTEPLGDLGYVWFLENLRENERERK